MFLKPQCYPASGKATKIQEVISCKQNITKNQVMTHSNPTLTSSDQSTSLARDHSFRKYPKYSEKLTWMIRNKLTCLRPMFHSYRNLSTDLHYILNRLDGFCMSGALVVNGLKVLSHLLIWLLLLWAYFLVCTSNHKSLNFL